MSTTDTAAKPRRRRSMRQRLLCAAIVLGVGTLGQAAEQRDLWALRPYAVHVVIATDTHSVNPQTLSRAIATHVEQRSAAVIGPIWRLTTTVATGAARSATRRAVLEHDIQRLPSTPPPTNAAGKGPTGEGDESGEQPGGEAEARPATAFEPQPATGFDKLMLVLVQESPLGFAVSVLEYDNHVRRLGSTQRQEVAAAAETREAAFRGLGEAFSPVALFSIDRQDYRRAELRFRGAELPRPAASPEWFKVNDVFQPIIRQSDRDGNVPPSGIREAPWTLLQVTDDGPEPTASVVSHTRRPFGARRRGRVEQLAIRLPITSPATRLRLHARGDTTRPLIGYHVFARDTPEADLLPLGSTNERGAVRVPRTESPIRTLYIKSGTKLVAKLPIAPGTADLMQAPLIDESKRIEAEARLSVLREELIDLVARRTILVSRTRAAIEAKDFSRARQFVADLEALPGLNVFNQRLTDQEQLSRARDPKVQSRIDTLFEQTRQVLGAFLSSREITRLRREVDEAAKKAEG